MVTGNAACLDNMAKIKVGHDNKPTVEIRVQLQGAQVPVGAKITLGPRPKHRGVLNKPVTAWVLRDAQGQPILFKAGKLPALKGEQPLRNVPAWKIPVSLGVLLCCMYVLTIVQLRHTGITKCVSRE